jgi:hypothetical protein
MVLTAILEGKLSLTVVIEDKSLDRRNGFVAYKRD